MILKEDVKIGSITYLSISFCLHVDQYEIKKVRHYTVMQLFRKIHWINPIDRSNFLLVTVLVMEQ